VGKDIINMYCGCVRAIIFIIKDDDAHWGESGVAGLLA